MNEQIILFLKKVREDPRISTVHICLYLSLWMEWYENGQLEPVSIYRPQLMNWAKISSLNTYHKCMRELHAYGYIRYVPSFNPYLGSLVYFI